MDELERLRQENERLQEENKQAVLAAKKLARTVKLLEGQLERNTKSAAAKDSLSRVIAEKRSELERYMNLLLGNCPDMILLFDKDERLAYCTESYLRVRGLASFGLAKGMGHQQLFEGCGDEAFISALAATYRRVYQEKRAVDFTGALDFGCTGAPRQYSVQVSPMMDENAAAVGSMIILTDTTEIRRAQQEAERANSAKSDFLATVSHEIRTPMNAIIGLANMLKDTGLDERQQGYLRNIQESSGVLLNLINDILDFSKIEAGKLEITPGYFRTADLLNHLQSMFSLMFEQKGLAFVCQFDPALPEVLYGDDTRVRQIVTNLLNNALKYTPAGAVTFHACWGADKQLVLAVSDTGIGIEAEEIPRLFSAFERLDHTRNKNVVGTGLGLAITKRLCQLMDGSIDVVSEHGAGSTFTVRLPLPTGTPADLPPEDRAEAIRFIAPTARVLLVDDIAINLEITAYMLDDYKIQHDFAANGREAVEKAAQCPYDLILMDHMMPEMDGVEATLAIRAAGGPGSRVPIIALTANAVSGAVEYFMGNGFNGFLSKPVDDTALAQCLLQWLPKDKVRRVEEPAEEA